MGGRGWEGCGYCLFTVVSLAPVGTAGGVTTSSNYQAATTTGLVAIVSPQDFVGRWRETAADAQAAASGSQLPTTWTGAGRTYCGHEGWRRRED
jgi:hypothetical protein